MTDKLYLSPPEIAELLGVSHHKVLAWIVQGELRGIDVSTYRGQRPRYKVARQELELFLERRTQSPPPPRPRRRPSSGDIIQRY